MPRGRIKYCPNPTAKVEVEATVALLAIHGIHAGHVALGGVISIGEKKMVYLGPATAVPTSPVWLPGLMASLLSFAGIRKLRKV